MNVAERPIVEARAVEIRKPAGRVEAVSRRAVDARVQHADVDASGNRGVEFRQQTVGRVLVGETHAVNRRLEPAAGERHSFRAPGEDLDQLRQGQLPGDAGLSVVVAADDERLDARLMEPPQLIDKKARRLHRRLFAVVEVASDQERIDLLRKAEINHDDKGFSRRPADQLRKLGVAQRQRRQRRIEVNVGGVNESDRHGLTGARLRNGQSHAGGPDRGG